MRQKIWREPPRGLFIHFMNQKEAGQKVSKTEESTIKF